MTTNPEVLRLARQIRADLYAFAYNKLDTLNGLRDNSDAVRAAIAAIEKTTELAAGYVAIDYDGQGHANGLRDYDHLRQSEKDNSNAD